MDYHIRRRNWTVPLPHWTNNVRDAPISTGANVPISMVGYDFLVTDLDQSLNHLDNLTNKLLVEVDHLLAEGQ